jgi:hypothetical protein
MRLFDVFCGPHATLLASDAATGQYGESLRVHPVAPDEAVIRRICGIADGYVLVRPDGCIGVIASDEADLRQAYCHF